MPEQDYALSVTFRSSAGYDASMFTVRANDPEELEARLQAINGTSLLDVIPEIASVFRKAEQQINPDATATGPSNSGGQRPRPADPGRPDGPAPTCQHGEKEWANPQGKDWKGWFCPLKDAQGRRVRGTGDCKPQYVND